MSNLEVRKFDWDFEGIPFLWNPEQPRFSVLMNQITFVIISFERYICRALVEAMAESAVGPTIELGLVALASALGMPRGSAVGWFAVGRCAGWVAHTLEQYEAGRMIRPRARYIGPRPGD